MRLPSTLLLIVGAVGMAAQTITNISCTSTLAHQVMKGQYDPQVFAADSVISDHGTILCELNDRVSPDSLHAYLVRLEQFQTRHTLSDTISTTTGIGAARRWCHAKFQQFSDANDGRLIPAYLRMDPSGIACGPGHGWRNVLAVLPGADTSNTSVVLIEAHLDSRCEEECDTICPAPGMEDNGSGSALVLELARVMSRYTYDHTIVFMLTIGEEQGLIGAEAMATWCVNEGIAIKGVQNNDVVGGVLCGQSASQPGCDVEGEVDSLQIRLFSHGSIAEPHRGYARTIRMYYQEKLQAHVSVPMALTIMNLEDRDGRAGDHIPFRMAGFRSMRFTSANEHGDGSVDSSWYVDRQHTSNDVLGIDTDGDLVVDSFFVDFNYLARNTVINGMSAALLALGPEPPAFQVHDEPAGLRVTFQGGPEMVAYRIGVRNGSNSLEFDALYRTSDSSFVVPGLVAGEAFFISTASIDAEGVMSPFSSEVVKVSDANTLPAAMDPLDLGITCGPIVVPEAIGGGLRSPILHPCVPDPFTDRTTIRMDLPAAWASGTAAIMIHDVHGRLMARLGFPPAAGSNQVEYRHQGPPGALAYSLIIEGRPVATRIMLAVD